MREEVIIGIDAGSTHLKTGIYSLKGDLLSIKHFRVPVYHSKPGYSEYKPEEIFCQMCRHLQEQLADSYHPAAIGISSFGESFVPMGADGSPLSDMIAWFDMRGEELINSLAEKSGTAFLYHLTGQYPSGKYALAKFLWLRKHNPDIIRKTHCFLFMQDYLAFRLTGQLCTDYSLASRSMLYDIREKKWDPGLLEQCGIHPSQLPIPLPSGGMCGKITSHASQFTGLPQGIPVVLAGHDHASASVAAGLKGKNIVLDSMGTSETAVFSSYDIDIEKAFSSRLCSYPYLKNERRIIASIQGCGASIEWLAGLLFEKDIYRRFFQSAQSGKIVREAAPVTLPFLRGVQEFPSLSASVLGLKDFHKKEDLCYSLLEGLCLEYLRRLKAGERICNTEFHTIRAVGRLSAEAVFMQLKADITGKTVEVLGQSEAVSQGAAILAGLFCGCISIWQPEIKTIYFPSNDLAFYKHRFQKYIQVLEELCRTTAFTHTITDSDL